MKNKKVFALACLSALSMCALTGCGNGVEAGGEHTIQVRLYKAGYGEKWLKDVIEKYEAVNPNHNKVEIIEASANLGEASLQEIQSPKDNQIDMYFLSSANLSDILGASKSALGRGSKDALLECVDDVFESKAIGFDGKEETKTIAERMFDGYETTSQYNGTAYANWTGKKFLLPWADGMTGILVNPAVLQQYGLDIPLTSDELQHCVDVIYDANKDKAKSDSSKIYPYSWAGKNASGYWEYLFETWFAQYSGKSGFDNFLKCAYNGDESAENIKNNGWKVYEDQGILKSLEAMYGLMDLKYSKSADYDHMQAQNEILQGKAAFMVTGDWILGEMANSSQTYFEKAKELKMIQTPILSSLASEVGLKNDAALHEVVSMIDENKTNADIKAKYSGINDSGIDKIRDARSIHDGIGSSHSILIPSYADAKEAAKEFVRYLYSEDGCRAFRNAAYANLPLSYEKKAEDTNTTYQQSLDKIYASGKPQMVSSTAQLNDVRNASQLYMFNCQTWSHPHTFKDIMKARDTLTPELVFTTERNTVRDSWDAYMSLVEF